MSIRVVLVIFFCLVLTGEFVPVPLEAASGRPPKPGRPPNIVLIVSDDQAWTDFGFMKHTAVRTPHLDRLAARSAVFRRGYVPSSLCRPSLATIITGLYPHQHGITGNDPPPGTDRSAHAETHPASGDTAGVARHRGGIDPSSRANGGRGTTPRRVSPRA